MSKAFDFMSGIRSKYGINIEMCEISPRMLDRRLRAACEVNVCGSYGKNWMCPPAVGDIDVLIEKALSYKDIIVFQHISTLEDSFDYEGMLQGQADFNSLILKIAEEANRAFENCLVLGAGGCRICDVCAINDGLPCLFPEKANPSLESYGFNVSELATMGGLKYINGVNTVTYFGAVLI